MSQQNITMTYANFSVVDVDIVVNACTHKKKVLNVLFIKHVPKRTLIRQHATATHTLFEKGHFKGFYYTLSSLALDICIAVPYVLSKFCFNLYGNKTGNQCSRLPLSHNSQCL